MVEEIEQYEALGNDTIKSVRTKIAQAQKDMAGFIADLSVFMPQTQKTPESVHAVGWKYISATDDECSDKKTEVTESWNDEIDILTDNLSGDVRMGRFVSHELCNLLVAFLYAAYINHVPLLAAGPCGQEMADALSMSVFGRKAGKLILNGEYDPNIIDAAEHFKEPVISIQNMFQKGWADTLPQDFSNARKQVFWTHPYTEDLLLEPRGLYNYGLPLFTECFIETARVSDFLAGKRSKNYKAYISNRKQALRLDAFQHLKLSKLSMNRIAYVLSDTKNIVGRETANKDIEVLFGLLPFCVLTEKTDLLKDVLENEKCISGVAKAAAMRYIEEE